MSAVCVTRTVVFAGAETGWKLSPPSTENSIATVELNECTWLPPGGGGGRLCEKPLWLTLRMMVPLANAVWFVGPLT